ncbi:hypothetical protein [Enterovibrio calviensis]|uniref:hypothetical protein n=1 Tax=Enterovibrio calviensis TaxID=91359 RepID=UPI000483FE84|nr:hypothetical protein [Enterovibrio calviensis]
MKPLNPKHTLLVMPFNQSASTSSLVSHLVLKLFNAVDGKIRAYQIKKVKEDVYREVADYPAYLLEDIGLQQEDIVAMTKKHSHRSAMTMRESGRR